MSIENNTKYDYDAVIIGSGVGGLSTAAYLAKYGIKILLCEQHSQPGGYFTSFKRKGYIFDGGIQACEDSNLLLPMLEDLGILDRIDLVKCKFALATPEFFGALTEISDLNSYYNHLISKFPHEKDVLEKLRKESIDFCQVMEGLWQTPNPMFKSWPDVIKEIPGWLLKFGRSFKSLPKFFRLFKVPIDEYLGEQLEDENLINLLCQIGYRGCPASFSMPFIYFIMDYYYPGQGGIQAIPDLLASCITENGGEIRYNAMVEKIIFENGQAEGIELKTGERITSRFVINNGDARRTYLKMLPPDAVDESYKSRLREAKVSESAFMVYLGVDIPPEDLPVNDCQHIVFIPDYEPRKYNDIGTDPEFYDHTMIMISIPSLHDKTLAPEGKSVINLSIPGSIQSFDYWGTEDGKRTGTYKALKEKVTDKLIANAEKLIPGLSEKIEVKFSATPFTFNRYTLNDSGTTAGWTYHPRESFYKGAKGASAYKTPVKNLYQVGHWGFSPGGATSGFVTGKLVSSIVRRELGKS